MRRPCKWGNKTSMAVTSTAMVLLLSATIASAQTLRIVTTTNDLASLARSVAGETAQVDVMIPPGADPEAFEPRPSDLAKLKDASVIVRVGLGYDHWLDKLLAMHGDANIQRRGAGYVDASVGIPLLEVKGRSLDPASMDGHAHGLANPHYWLDPQNAEVITGAILEATAAVAPHLADQVAMRRADFLARLGENSHPGKIFSRPTVAPSSSPITTPGPISHAAFGSTSWTSSKPRRE